MNSDFARLAAAVAKAMRIQEWNCDQHVEESAINFAFRVVEACRDRGLKVNITIYPGTAHEVLIGSLRGVVPNVFGNAEDEDLAYAILLAAARALGVDPETKHADAP